MSKVEEFPSGRREPSRTSFWVSILLLVLIGLTIFAVFKLVSSLIGI
jgi:hypothetical protein